MWYKQWSASFFFKKDFTYLFLEKGEGREKERERNINVWLPLMHSLLGTWPATQACALIGNRTSDPLVPRLVLNPLSHTTSFVCMWILLFNTACWKNCPLSIEQSQLLCQNHLIVSFDEQKFLCQYRYFDYFSSVVSFEVKTCETSNFSLFL